MSNFTQTEIAKQTGVSIAHISQIANGNNRPSYELAKRLATIFINTEWWEWIDDPKQTWIKANCTTNANSGIKAD